MFPVLLVPLPWFEATSCAALFVVLLVQLVLIDCYMLFSLRGFLAADCVSDVGPASVIVGNLVQGNRLASAQGRDMGIIDEDNDSSKMVFFYHFP